MLSTEIIEGNIYRINKTVGSFNKDERVIVEQVIYKGCCGGDKVLIKKIDKDIFTTILPELIYPIK